MNDGSYWIADTNNNRVVHLDGAGVVVATISGITSPRGVGVDASGNVYIASNSASDGQEVQPDGQSAGHAGHTGQRSDERQVPSRAAYCRPPRQRAALDRGLGDNRVVVMTLDGKPVGTFGSLGSGAGQLKTPKGLAVSPLDGQVVVADFANNRLSVWAE